MIKELPIEITPKALSKIKLIMQDKEIPEGYGLRVGTNKSASCGTTSFLLGFDEQKTGDDSFEVEGVNVYINKKEMLYLMGITLNFIEGEEESGFRFDKV